MKMTEMFLKEMAQEAETTRKMLSRIPEDKYDWKPHTKSMSVKQLAGHIAELPEWISMAINSDELDFAKIPYAPKEVKTNKEVLAILEKALAGAKTDLEKAKDDIMGKEWVMRSGKDIYYTASKGDVIRMTFSQIVHHRAQMGVFLRLLNVPIPASYGPSADEH
ncbi:MAG TPA: DinB family protein [Bacteroidia bacterium]|jgi:uncharacterized damage-inducible protein DinB|nr:DinB family protein [Bacteroidia bacterium]